MTTSGRILFGFALTLLLVACVSTTGPASEQDIADPPAESATEPGEQDPDDDAERVEVMATLAPIAHLVEVVGGDRVDVTSLVPSGADAHTYEPRPGDVARLTQVGLYVGVGLELNQAALELAQRNVGPGVPVVLLGEESLDFSMLVHDHGHSHGDDGHSHGDDGHTHGEEQDSQLGPNPHVWTSLRNTAHLVDGIVDALTLVDPAGAETFNANAGTLLGQLDDLDARIEQAIATVPDGNRVLVAYHDAWTYFARDYGLDFAVAVQPSDYAEPSAAEVRAVIDLMRDLDVPALFGAQEFPVEVIEAIAAETGATYVGDLADDSLPGSAGDPDHTYLELMRRNAALIVTGLGGDPAILESA